MTTLQDLLELDGVVAAGEFGRDGSLVGYEASMDMSPEMAQRSAQFCATVTMMFDTLSGAFSQGSGMNWTPQRAWTYSGGDWTVVIGEGGTKGVFAETAEADLDDLVEELS